MELFLKLANNGKFWSHYFIITGVISFLCNIVWRWRMWDKVDCKQRMEAFQTTIWNMAVHFLGFVLFFIQIQIFALIYHTKSAGIVATLGFIGLVLFFYSIFCISGRGIEIIGITLHKCSEIHITWRGIILKLKDDIKD